MMSYFKIPYANAFFIFDRFVRNDSNLHGAYGRYMH
jgi:hypothetical protein